MHDFIHDLAQSITKDRYFAVENVCEGIHHVYWPSSLNEIEMLVKVKGMRTLFFESFPESECFKVEEMPKLLQSSLSFPRLTASDDVLALLEVTEESILLDNSCFIIVKYSSSVLAWASRALACSLPEVLEETHWGLNSPLPSLMYLSLSNNHLVGSISEVHFSKLNKLKFLGLSSNSFFSNLKNPLTVVPFADVDLSSNFLEGPTPLSSFEIELLELSNYRFCGPIPKKLAQSMPNLVFLSLSVMTYRSIPSSIGNCSFLNAMDLSFKNLSGQIPLSFSRLNQLRSLHLSNNKLTGSLPSSFQNLSNLETLDLGNNRLSCEIPPWIGSGFADLRILSLRSNAFFSEIPSTLSNLSSLQVLDLAKNNLAGSIPVTFGDFKAMSLEQYINEYLPYGKYRGVYYEESLIVNIKGGAQKYTKTLSLVTSRDLASNNLHGEFPKEITKLVGLVALNLSKNQVIGYLNLSDNNFSGMIPYMGHVTTFDASSFDGNSGLRGAPLVLKCPGNDSNGGGGSIVEDSSDGFSDMWFYLSIGLGFAVGILVPFLIFSIRKPWSHAYFLLVDKTVDRLLYLACKTATRFRNRCNFQA
ncbi:receptor-like protein EIX2 [Hevea brasiliensis]|uniref:receptor-like protein EIX2 n=1 Tax=Hevea brasiliensis TaxID=3981 RepID=UPI0025E622CD|nr:receptor-like protein EIX2 [Hevea brasiliensis]